MTPTDENSTPNTRQDGDNRRTQNQPPGIIRNRTKKKEKSSSPTSVNSSFFTDTKNKSFNGVTEDIDAVLCLVNEDVDAGKEGFTGFQTKLEEYVLREYDNARDIMPLILNLTDPMDTFEQDNMPKTKYTTEEIEKDPIKKKLVENAVNKFSRRLSDLDTNVVSLWGHIWGQCTNALQAELKADAEFKQKRATYDALWLLKTCKKLIASIDGRGNKYYNAYKVLMAFNKVYQKNDESLHEWLTRFQSEVETLYLTGCDHIFYSEQLSSLGTAATDEDILTEKKKMEAIYIFLDQIPSVLKN